MKFYTFLLAISASLLAICSAYFSITGLAQLFAGSAFAIMFMAGSLEFAKLISASFVYYYWKDLPKLIKSYLIIGILALVFISSLGIYGFLTSAYQASSEKLELSESRIENYETRIDRYETYILEYNNELNGINSTINSLNEGITNNQIQYETEAGNVITTTSRNQRESIERQLEDYRGRRSELNNRIDAYSDSVQNYEERIFQSKTNLSEEIDLGPLQYIAEVSNLDMDAVVNYLSLIIVFVFDPLAVILVIAFNMSLKLEHKENNKNKSIQNIVKEQNTKEKNITKLKETELFTDEDKEDELMDEISRGRTETKNSAEKDSVLNDDSLFKDPDKHYPSLT